MQLSPEDQKRVFGKDKLKTAYQTKKRRLSLNRRVKRVHSTSMSSMAAGEYPVGLDEGMGPEGRC